MQIRAAEQQALTSSRRVSTRTRATIGLAAQALSLLAVPASHRSLAVLALAVAVAWNGWLLVRLRRPGSASVLIADTAIVCALLAAQPVLDVPALVAEGAGWGQMVAVTMVVAHHWQFPELRLRTQVWTSAATGLVFALGAGRVTGFTEGSVIEPAVWIVVVSLLSRFVFGVLRSAARRVDDADEARARQESRAEVAQARRAAAQEHSAALHDTVAATLTMVGQGSLPAGDPRLAAQAGRDLQVLRAPGEPAGGDLAGALADVVAESGLPVEWNVTGVPGAVPPVVVAAFSGALREALLNVARHGGGRGAHLDLRWSDGSPVVEIVNDAVVPVAPFGSFSEGRGLRHSIVERMQRVGGRAVVTPAGGGVRVRLEWAAADVATSLDPPSRPPMPAGVIRRRFRLSMIFILLVVVTRAVFTDANHDWPIQAAGFAVLYAGVALAARSPRGFSRYVVLAAATAAVAVITATIPAGQLLGSDHTTWRVTGYYAVLLFIDTALARLAGLLLAVTVVTFVQFGLAGRLDRTGVILFAATVTINLGCQVSAALAVRIFERLGLEATRLSEEDARLRTDALVTDQLRADRQQRYRDVAGTVVPLLEGLRSGELSPADPAVQQRSSVEAARLRRLMAEGDEVSDPLVHELRACVDAAQRAGVRVDVAVRGAGPVLAVPERRRLTEPVIEVLFRARSRARVILIAEPRDVTVSIVADVDHPDDPLASADGWAEVVRSGDRLWVTSRWSDRPR